MQPLNEIKISVIGLGYVGLPLAVELSKHFETTGFDINSDRVNHLNSGLDQTCEVPENELSYALNHGLFLTTREFEISDSNVFIITVPTPIDEFKSPNLQPLIKATTLVSKCLKVNDVVVYESTTYPGCTEEICVPILEKHSNLKYNKGFFCGYSPERINPGDKQNTLKSIVKVTSGSTKEAANFVDGLYRTIITAGTFKASSIRVAEASKAIENAQRDVNISFVNELSLIFDRLGIDTREVLEAAGTKWNFLKFSPGLVGGHCIGVDPYYLAHKAQQVGYYPEVILSGRRINDSMGIHVANSLVKMMINKNIAVKNSKVLILGVTFKENCPDIRNTRVVDIISELKSFDIQVDVCDPRADKFEVEQDLSISLLDKPNLSFYDGIVIAVPHDEFYEISFDNLNTKVLFDLKGMLPKNLADKRL